MQDVLAFITLMACLTVFVGSLVALVRPLPKVGMGTRKRALCGIGVAFGLFILTAAIMPAPKNDSGSERKAANHASKGSVAAADDQIAEVNSFAETKHASIKVDLKQGWDADDLPVQAAMVVEAAGEAMKAGASDMPKEVDTIAFWFTAPVTDPYGNETRSKVLEFTVHAADLRQVQYGKIAPQGLLEFADDIEVRPAARQGVADFCADSGSSNRLFCAKVSR